MYKASELREKTREELLHLISELKGKLLALRFESATGQLTETHLPSATRKDVALIFTVLKEKEQGIVIKTKISPIKKNEKVKKTNSENKEKTPTEPIIEKEAIIKNENNITEKEAIIKSENNTPEKEESKGDTK